MLEQLRKRTTEGNMKNATINLPFTRRDFSMSIKRFAAAVLFLVFSDAALAYTECPSIMLTKIWTDVDGAFFVATGGYLNGYISATSKHSVGIAINAYNIGRPVIIRYARDGVVCGSAVWDEQISGIGM